MYCRKYSAGLSTYAKQHKQSSKIQIVEVGPRDGIQNEKKILTVEQRVTLIEKLLTAGLTKIEVGAFVSPKWVPQMANTAELYKRLRQLPGVSYPCLVPNVRGMETAIELGVKEIAIFVSAT